MRGIEWFSDTEVVTERAWKENFHSRFSIIFVVLPGLENDECKTFPFMAFPLFVLVPTDDDSLLLVDENDIRELSSPRDQ